MIKRTFKYILSVGITIAGLANSQAQAPKPDTAKVVIKHTPPLYKDYLPDKYPVGRKEGLLNVLKVETHYMLEIKNSLLDKDILCVSRIIRSAAGLRSATSSLGYGGDEINENEIRFERISGNKLLVRQVSYDELPGDSTQSMYRSVSNSNLQSIAGIFDIKSISKGNDGVIIDITDYLNGDNDLLFLDPSVKKALSIGAYQPDKSYIENIDTYPNNTEIKVVKTYVRSPDKPGDPGPAGTISIELNCSMLLLPENPMRPRYADARVGYFRNTYEDFDKDPQSAKKIQTITRWRLEPKPEDMDKYLRGELVEPQKPIVFYIDPATPKKWVPYLIQAVNDWQKAFEQAGFKNAIFAREAPSKAQDSTWSLEDARYSAIVWKSSVIPNASGPNVHDPRTGEILESHINWYHQVLHLLHNWYMIQCGATDPKARKMEFDDELMGQLIRFVCSHEVGHTLGLVHNFGSSSTVPVDSLRNKAWVEKNGHTPSIMDYARFNYVAQPEDHISEAGLLPRIGDYDKWAVEWGYRVLPGTHTADDERTTLNQWTIQKLKNKRLWFGREDNPDDPRCQSEDIGDDAMKASGYGIKNLRYILAHLGEWTKTPNEGYDNLKEMYTEVITQYGRYMGHVTKNVGGIMEDPKMVEQPGPVYLLTPKEKQALAIAFLDQKLFTAPQWLFYEPVLGKTGFNPVAIARFLQNGPLAKLLSVGTLKKLLSAEAREGNKAYTASELLTGLDGTIWKELHTHTAINLYKRNLQKEYISDLEKLTVKPAQGAEHPELASVDPTNSDVTSIARTELNKLKTEIDAALPFIKDPLSRDHLKDVRERIDVALDTRKFSQV
ncbi:zinc-dependent metalloprotease [Mucilaginibacter sp. dw_454]|uniref:zinc-dependent metalloprotease n=1 Tax=Mucilaginibacter sp. dw_454 TaxID=2720079 RepID=UPI001BD47846|nr:zinc-dependent metalloprotease [Mucilaginibacter sp. dw_454]